MSWSPDSTKVPTLLEPVLSLVPKFSRAPWYQGLVVAGVERRVRVADYDRLRADDPRLMTLPHDLCAPGRSVRLHWAAAETAAMMLAEARSLGFTATVRSGWRRHAWKSREQYNAAMIARYGSVARGQKYRAYDSAHETGLAIDLVGAGLAPRSSTISSQRKAPFYRWLIENAQRYGWAPYLAEPWHWETAIPRELFDRRP